MSSWHCKKEFFVKGHPWRLRMDKPSLVDNPWLYSAASNVHIVCSWILGIFYLWPLSVSSHLWKNFLTWLLRSFASPLYSTSQLKLRSSRSHYVPCNIISFLVLCIVEFTCNPSTLESRGRVRRSGSCLVTQWVGSSLEYIKSGRKTTTHREACVYVLVCMYVLHIYTHE